MKFASTEFCCRAVFRYSIFFDRAYFSGEFKCDTEFTHVLFDDGEKINFDLKNLSNVSFTDTDITRVRFDENVRWGPGKDRSKIIDEVNLEKEIKESMISVKNLSDITAVYRNLRENYEYRFRYDEAGEFFIREMEIKRNYRRIDLTREEYEIKEREMDLNRQYVRGDLKKKEYDRKKDKLKKELRELKKDKSKKELREEDKFIVERNNRRVRNLSLTNLYYRLAKYGEDLRRPVIFASGVIILSIVIYYIIQASSLTYPITFSLKGLSPIGRAFENGTTVFLQLRNEHLVWYDYIFKLLGIVTFGIFVIPLRRRFERKFRH